MMIQPEIEPPEIIRSPVERVPAGEDAAIEAMICPLKAQLTKRYASKGLIVRRDAHPKHHALVEATFAVDPKCPAELRIGIFASNEPYRARLRFSNGDPVPKHDLEPDVRGLAIKLLDAPRSLMGPNEHDFLVATGEAFFGSDAVDYVDFPAASESIVGLFRFFLRPRWTRLRGGFQLVAGMKLPTSPINVDYFSQVPYRLGPHCVKYHVRPQTPTPLAKKPWYLRPVIRHLLAVLVFLVRFFRLRFIYKRLGGFDALRESLIHDLAPENGREPVILEFLVQRWPDLSTIPVWAIEDATRRWSLPWVKAAAITIERQPGDVIRAGDKDAERLSFQPWHASDVHQPLGSISRARRAVYLEMSRFRNRLNKVES